MSRWIDLYGMTGVYESEVINIASDFDYFISKISHKYITNDGVIALDMRVSLNNGVTWTDWIKINNTSYKPFFDGKGLSLSFVKFQYRVTMDLGNKFGKVSPEFDFFHMDLIGAYKIDNIGDVILQPEIWIKKTNGSGDIRLTNETNGMSLEMKNLNNGEEVYIDCENKDIVSSLPLVYRYKDHNGVFIELEVGENLLTGEGDFKLDIRLQFKLLQ